MEHDILYKKNIMQKGIEKINLTSNKIKEFKNTSHRYWGSGFIRIFLVIAVFISLSMVFENLILYILYVLFLTILFFLIPTLLNHIPPIFNMPWINSIIYYISTLIIGFVFLIWHWLKYIKDIRRDHGEDV